MANASLTGVGFYLRAVFVGGSGNKRRVKQQPYARNGRVYE